MSHTETPEQERVIWEGRTAWMDHAVLYLFLAMAMVRAAVAARAEEWFTAGLYVLAVTAFFGIAAWFHYSHVYRLTSRRVEIRSGWTGRVLQEFPLKDISDVTLRYELLNRWFDLGALELACRTTEQACTIRGIPQAEHVKDQLVRWIKAQRSPWEPITVRGTPDHAR